MSVFRYLLTTLMIAVISGCGSVQEPDTATGTEAEPTTTEPTPKPAVQDCDWSRKRGIAELMEIRNGIGLFHFHPNGIPVTQGIDPDWAVGDEFKAILETPEPEDCAENRLTEIRPLAPAD